MRGRTVFSLPFGAFVLAACATIVNGTTQSIEVVTPPIEGAACELTNSEGTWFVTSPGKATVHKTKNDLKIICRKDGFQEGSTTLESRFVADTAGNIIFGGGILIAAPIDALTGANYEYPTVTAIPMVPIVESAMSAMP
jgi:hypothetical protein